MNGNSRPLNYVSDRDSVVLDCRLLARAENSSCGRILIVQTSEDGLFIMRPNVLNSWTEYRLLYAVGIMYYVLVIMRCPFWWGEVPIPFYHIIISIHHHWHTERSGSVVVHQMWNIVAYRNGKKADAYELMDACL